MTHTDTETNTDTYTHIQAGTHMLTDTHQEHCECSHQRDEIGESHLEFHVCDVIILLCRSDVPVVALHQVLVQGSFQIDTKYS